MHSVLNFHHHLFGSCSSSLGDNQSMVQNELKETLAIFSDGNGFGDPDARRNAEQRVQILTAVGQQEREEKVIAIAQEANDIARAANKVAARSEQWAMYAAIAAVIALVISVIGLQK